MKTHEVKTFEFKELSKEAQETALRNYNTDIDFEIFNEDFKESIKYELAENGFLNAEYEEYDLSCYKSRPYINIKWVSFDLDKFIKPSQKWIKESNISFDFEKNEIIIYNEDKISKRAENILNVLKEKMQNKFNETIQNLIKGGLEQIRYIESDETKQDTIEANEYEFLENGKRW